MNATVLRLMIELLRGELGRLELVIDQRFDAGLSRQIDLHVGAIDSLEDLFRHGRI